MRNCHLPRNYGLAVVLSLVKMFRGWRRAEGQGPVHLDFLASREQPQTFDNVLLFG
jgi:hypothetical protein